MTTPTCRTCRFWKEHAPWAPEHEAGDCRRRAPIVLHGTTSEGEDRFGFPESRADQWCGEHEAAPAPEPTPEPAPPCPVCGDESQWVLITAGVRFTKTYECSGGHRWAPDGTLIPPDAPEPSCPPS